MTLDRKVDDSQVSPRQGGPVVFSLVSLSGAGKTTFLERLLPELKSLGIRTGVVKHHSHITTFDVPGKDTYRLTQAGADIVIGASPVEAAIFVQRDASGHLEQLIDQYCGELDLVITEGFRGGGYPKIELHRAARSAEEGLEGQLVGDPTELIAVLSDEPLDLSAEIPVFDLDAAPAVARWLGDYVRVNRLDRLP